MNTPTEIRTLIDYYAADIMNGFSPLMKDRREYAIQVIERATCIKALAHEYYALAVKAADGNRP